MTSTGMMTISGLFVLTADEPMPAGTLEMFLELLRATHGGNLLRIKGIVKLAEMPETPVVVHGVQHVFHPTARPRSLAGR
jgi:G3E family GTPase